MTGANHLLVSLIMSPCCLAHGVPILQRKFYLHTKHCNHDVDVEVSDKLFQICFIAYGKCLCLMVI